MRLLAAVSKQAVVVMAVVPWVWPVELLRLLGPRPTPAALSPQARGTVPSLRVRLLPGVALLL
jgi:hypothetical protein